MGVADQIFFSFPFMGPLYMLPLYAIFIFYFFLETRNIVLLYERDDFIDEDLMVSMVNEGSYDL